MNCLLSRQSTGDVHRHFTQFGIDAYVERKTARYHRPISSSIKQVSDHHSPFRPLNDRTSHIDELSHHTLPILSTIKFDIVHLIL